MIDISHHWITVWIKVRGHLDTYFDLFLLHFRHISVGLAMSIFYLKMGNTLVNKTFHYINKNGTVRRLKRIVEEQGGNTCLMSYLPHKASKNNL
jgi:hypothetical protein